MLIAHISDFHVFADTPETLLVRADVADVARKIVTDIAAHQPRFDAVVFTGDLADGGSDADYNLLKNILAPLDMPVFAVPGNHDTRAGMRTAFSGVLPYGRGPRLNYQTHLGDIRIIALDTLVDGQVHGALDPSQLDWLSSLLATPSRAPTVIAMHHPPCPSGMTKLDAMALTEGRDAFGALVAGYTAPLYILCGHIHRPFQAMWHGAFCQVGGGPSFQHRLDLRPDAPEPGSVPEPYAYFILRREAQDIMTIHKRYVSL